MAQSRLRIAGGRARGLPITEPRGTRLRPTSGLVREAIFNIVGDLVDGARVLDLYAGTGALGLEALSRGAREAVFVEGDGAACQAILQTIGRAGFREQAKVIRGRLPAALASVEGDFELILMDPPYEAEGAEETLAGLSELLAAGGLVVYEHGSRYNPPDRPAGLVLEGRRVYGDTAIALYSLQEAE